MLRLPAFQLHQPSTLDEALSLLAGAGDGCRLVAGGTDLWPNMKRRHQSASTVISLQAVDELHGIVDSEEGLAIGAMTSLDEVAADPRIRAHYPALATAVDSISSPPLRNMGTIGGNLCVDTRCTYYNQTEEWRRSIDYCLKEKGDVCWVAPGSSRCWAHSASDSAPILCALGATVEILSPTGRRTIPVTDLFHDDGIRYLTLEPGEIVTRILLPATAAGDRCRSAFWKLRRRGSIDFAVFSVAAVVWTDDAGVVTEARLHLGAVASHPVAAGEAAAALVGRELTTESIRAAARLARKPATPMDNTDFQAQWRGLMVERYVESALGEIAGIETGRLPPNHILESAT